jgi:hypothetical protein
MSGVLWSKFFWSDHESDPSLRLCSLAAQGLWMRMLCIAAQHDPIGFVCVSGQPLDVTALARMTGSAEAEVAVLMTELSRNGVCSRDRSGRLYSRRMVKDAQAVAKARIDGLRGGNPVLGGPSSPSKRGRKSSTLKGRDKGGVKPQSPEASTRVEDPCGSSNPGGAAEAVRPPQRRPASSSPDGGGGDALWATFRRRVLERHGEDYARAWLDRSDWRPAERTVVVRLGIAAERLRRDLRPLLKDLDISIEREGAPHGMDAG